MARIWERLARAARGPLRGASGQFERLTLRAAALTYLSSLALVPLGALALAVLGFVGLRSQGVLLKQIVLANLGLSRETALEVGALMSQADAGAASGLSGLLLLGAAAALFFQIEAAFNEIWEVKRKRPLGRRLLFFLGAIVAGPFCLGLSILLTSTVGRSAVMEIPLVHWSLAIRPILLVFLGLFALYQLAPNSRVQPFAAALAAALAAPAWEIAKHAYAVFAVRAFQRNALIYGSLAAIPVLLLWIQLSWFIVLVGAQIARSIQLALDTGTG